MDATSLPIVMEDKLVQWAKVNALMEVTDFGMDTE